MIQSVIVIKSNLLLKMEMDFLFKLQNVSWANNTQNCQNNDCGEYLKYEIKFYKIFISQELVDSFHLDLAVLSKGLPHVFMHSLVIIF